MNAQTTQVDDLRLIALPTAVNCTDLFVRFTLAEWSLRALVDDAKHAALELVTAAVDKANSQEPGFITVRLRLRGDSLLIELEESQLAQPPATLKHLRTGVESMGSRGTFVWCELPLPTGVTASGVPLPRRDPKRSQNAEHTSDEPHEVDPQVLQRLLSGLGGSPDGSQDY